MEIILVLLTLVAVAGAAVGRWTAWHPLVGALGMGIVTGTLGMVAMAGFATEGGAILLAGTFASIAGGGVAAFGAFMGWLRRTHLEMPGASTGR